MVTFSDLISRCAACVSSSCARIHPSCVSRRAHIRTRARAHTHTHTHTHTKASPPPVHLFFLFVGLFVFFVLFFFVHAIDICHLHPHHSLLVSPPDRLPPVSLLDLEHLLRIGDAVRVFCCCCCGCGFFFSTDGHRIARSPARATA